MLAQLVRLNDALAWPNDRSDSYLVAVRLLQDLMGAQLAPSFLVDETGTKLLLVAEEEQQRLLHDLGYDSMPAAVHLRDPWINEHEWPVSAADHLDHESWAILPEDFKAWFGTSGIVVSLRADHRHLGAVLLCFDHDFRMTDEQRDFLAAAGRILGNAVHRWQSASRERELGALQERRRLGDELHVDLSQQVAALGLHVEAMRLDLDETVPVRLTDDIGLLATRVDLLKRSLRHQMLGMRADAALIDSRLTATVREHVEEFRRQFGIDAVLECPDPDAADEVPLVVAAQLVRVLQEALSNAQLHARASRVVVRLSAARTRVRLEIHDDGTGFDSAQVGPSKLGIRIMGERMEQVDGTFRAGPAPGGGTLVVAQAPLRAAGNPASLFGVGRG